MELQSVYNYYQIYKNHIVKYIAFCHINVLIISVCSISFHGCFSSLNYISFSSSFKIYLFFWITALWTTATAANNVLAQKSQMIVSITVTKSIHFSVHKKGYICASVNSSFFKWLTGELMCSLNNRENLGLKLAGSSWCNRWLISFIRYFKCLFIL